MNGLFKEPLQERAATEGSRKAESDRQTPPPSPSKSRPPPHQANKAGSWKITWTNLFYIEEERFCLKLQKEGEFIGAEGLRRPTQRCASVLRANVCIFHQHCETKSCSVAKNSKFRSAGWSHNFQHFKLHHDEEQKTPFPTVKKTQYWFINKGAGMCEGLGQPL